MVFEVLPARQTSLFGRPDVIPQALTTDSVLRERVLKPKKISNLSVAQ